MYFMEEKEVYISSGSRPFTLLVIAAVYFTMSGAFMYTFIKGFMDEDLSIIWLFASFFTFMLGVSFSRTKNFHFDIKNKRFKKKYRIGSFTYGFWKPLPELEYISVFNFKGRLYQINLWIKGNDFYTITTLNDLQIALEEGKSIAKKLDIDLLDAATDPRNSIWVALNK